MKKKDQVRTLDPKEELEESWESEADPNRREWGLRYRFYRPTPDRYGLVCGTCKYGGHRSRDCPTNWGKDPRSLEPNCTIDGEYRHKDRWRDRKIGIERIDAPLPPTRKAKRPGNAAGSPVKKLEEGWPQFEYWTCGLVGHFSADCQLIRTGIRWSKRGSHRILSKKNMSPRSDVSRGRRFCGSWVEDH